MDSPFAVLKPKPILFLKTFYHQNYLAYSDAFTATRLRHGFTVGLLCGHDTNGIAGSDISRREEVRSDAPARSGRAFQNLDQDQANNGL